MKNETKATIYTVCIGIIFAAFIAVASFNPVLLFGILVLIFLLVLAAIAFGVLTAIYDAILDRLERHERKS